MKQEDTSSQFEATLLRPRTLVEDSDWAFVILPKAASSCLPRRGRTTVVGTVNGQEFQALLEPDGQKSHWLRIEDELLESSGAGIGEVAQFRISSVSKEPEPEVPADFADALEASAEARTTWNQTTTLARVDWIHWIVSAKQAKTRAKRINDACEQLASGKRRVCCFDPSGFYSKALSAPEVADF